MRHAGMAEAASPGQRSKYKFRRAQVAAWGPPGAARGPPPPWRFGRRSALAYVQLGLQHFRMRCPAIQNS